MTSSAISAQGSSLQISTGTGAAVNITGLVTGFPTIVKATAHGLTNGGVVSFAALTGNTVLNGQTCVVTNVTANTFAVDVDTTGGPAWVSGGTATPVQWTKIKNLISFKGFDGQAAELDATDLDSVAKEFRIGLQDWGNVQIDMNRDFNDPGQQALDASKRSASLQTYLLTLPSGATRTFSAYCKASPLEGGVDKLLQATSVTLRISGDVTDA
jgi:Ubiquitin-activating enzyme E1 FCCH domain/Lambda phage tail tube protein, TTP